MARKKKEIIINSASGKITQRSALTLTITFSATTPPIPTYTLTFSPGRQQSMKLQHNRRT